MFHASTDSLSRFVSLLLASVFLLPVPSRFCLPSSSISFFLSHPSFLVLVQSISLNDHEVWRKGKKEGMTKGERKKWEKERKGRSKEREGRKGKKMKGVKVNFFLVLFVWNTIQLFTPSFLSLSLSSFFLSFVVNTWVNSTSPLKTWRL